MRAGPSAALVHDGRLMTGWGGGDQGMGLARYGDAPPPFLLPASHGGWIAGGGSHHELARFISDEAINGPPAGAARDHQQQQQQQGAHFDFDQAAASPTFIDFLGVGAT